MACQAPLFMGFSWHEYWSGPPFPSPGNHPDLEMEPKFPSLQADSLPSEHRETELCLMPFKLFNQPKETKKGKEVKKFPYPDMTVVLYFQLSLKQGRL